MAPPSNRASTLRASTRPVSGSPARVAARVKRDEASTCPSWATRTAGVRIGALGQQAVDVVEGEQPDQVLRVGAVQVHPRRPDLREEGLGVAAEQVERSSGRSALSRRCRRRRRRRCRPRRCCRRRCCRWRRRRCRPRRRRRCRPRRRRRCRPRPGRGHGAGRVAEAGGHVVVLEGLVRCRGHAVSSSSARTVGSAHTLQSVPRVKAPPHPQGCRALRRGRRPRPARPGAGTARSARDSARCSRRGR